MKVYVLEWYDWCGESSWTGQVFDNLEKAEAHAKEEHEKNILYETKYGTTREEAEYLSDKYHILEREVN